LDIYRQTDHLGQTRSFAAVLFRRVSTRTRKDPNSEYSKEIFLTIPEPQRNAIREKLLQALGADNPPQVRNKISDAVAEIARQYSEEGMQPLCSARLTVQGESWNDLLGALFHSSQAPDAGQRETAFRIFATTPGIIERQHEEVVLTAFTRGFKDPDSNVLAHHGRTASLTPPGSHCCR
jgi:hypothetical protein